MIERHHLLRDMAGEGVFSLFSTCIAYFDPEVLLFGVRGCCVYR
jgi:hypothetical protein